MIHEIMNPELLLSPILSSAYCIYLYKRPRGDAFFQKGGLLLQIKKSTLESSSNER